MTGAQAKRGRPKRGTPQGVTQLLLLRPVLVEVCAGDPDAALLLSQFLNWSDGRPEADGWFTATQAEISAKTGLSRYAQEAARGVLRDCGFLTEQRRGQPALLFYRADRHAIEESVTRCVADRSDFV